MWIKHFEESELSKGETRKLAALRKSLGQEIADEAFNKWYQQQKQNPKPSDHAARLIEELLLPEIDKIRIGRNLLGYLVRRGRNRFIVEAVPLESDFSK